MGADLRLSAPRQASILRAYPTKNLAAPPEGDTAIRVGAGVMRTV
jgi:hypothetical protein